MKYVTIEKIDKQIALLFTHAEFYAHMLCVDSKIDIAKPKESVKKLLMWRVGEEIDISSFDFKGFFPFKTITSKGKFFRNHLLLSACNFYTLLSFLFSLQLGTFSSESGVLEVW